MNSGTTGPGPRGPHPNRPGSRRSPTGPGGRPPRRPAGRPHPQLRPPSGQRVPKPSPSLQPRLRHLLLRAGSIPAELPVGKPYTIGRSGECNLTVPSQKISRAHAEVRWVEAAPWIHDLKSQNGIQVNGRRVTEHALKDGDEIQIGPFLCTYRCVAAIGSVATLSRGLADSNAMTQPMTSDSLAGNLEQMNPFELLQTLEFNQKCGTLKVYGDDDDALIVIRDGVPSYAETGDIRGQEAILNLLTWTEGQFNFTPEIDREDCNVTTSITNLLLEAGRRLDEEAASDQELV